jgi:hypothetical protein
MRNREPDVVEDAFLNAYPNPARIGCLPDNERPAVLRSLARKELPIDHPYREHLGHCSPCFREFVPYRDAYRTERARARFLRIAAVAAMVLIAVSLAVYLLMRKPAGLTPVARNPVISTPADNWAAVTLDYRDASPLRGAEPQRIVREQSAPRKRDALKIVLPFGSDDGQYEIEIVGGPTEPSGAKAWNGAARIQDGLTILEVKADLSGFSPGHYMLAYRHGDASWRTVPLIVE